MLGYGAALGISGAALQAMFANPLASPDISGASSGAALGAVIGGYWLGFSQPLALAACGAAGAAGALLAAARCWPGGAPIRATCCWPGWRFRLAAGAATSLALALAPSPFAFYDAFDWLMGSFVDRSLGQAAAALDPGRHRLRPALAPRPRARPDRAGRGCRRLARPSRRAAWRWKSSPCRPSRSALASSVAGAIGFVGLVAPVLARRLIPRPSRARDGSGRG